MASDSPAAATPVYAVDFDGKICGYAFPGCGPPVERTVALLRRLKAEGWRIIIHTSRVNGEWAEPQRTRWLAEMLAYLDDYDVPFDRVWGVMTKADSGGRHGWCFNGDYGKPVAHVYDDDRSLGDDDLEGRSVDDLVARAWLLYHRGERQHADSVRAAAENPAGRSDDTVTKIP